MKLLNDWPHRYAQVTPDRVAVTDPLRGEKLTWRDLDRRAALLAGFLAREAQLGPGDRVAVLAENRLETVVAFFAVARLRATLVPLNAKLSLEELARVVGMCAPRVLLVSGALGAEGDALVQGAAQKPVVVSYDARPGAISFADALRGPATDAIAVVDENDPWLVLYTSGSTGVPKGALITHKQIVWNAIHTAGACDLVRDDATVTSTPFFYTGGWNVLSTPLWYHGATVHLLPQFDAPRILDLVQREKISVLFGVPTTLAALRDDTGFASADLSSLRVVLSGGAACPPALNDAWFARGVVLRQGYGLTEVGPNCFGLLPADARRKPASIGRPNLHLEWRVTDEAGQDVAPGAEGELRLRGPTLFGGYLNDEAATRAAIDTEGYFRTGDIVRVDDEGLFWIVGRKNDLFKSGGEKVYAGEVEAAIAKHEAVAEVVVLGVPDEKWGEVGRAVVVARAGAPLDPEQLRTWLQARLARFKVPKTVVVVASLPRTETGKIARAKVRSRWGGVVEAVGVGS